VAESFEDKYLIPKNGKFLLDVASCNYDLLVKHGLKINHIQKSVLCSYGYKTLLHSYRRDGQISGRAIGLISIKNPE
jgi:copper oxidase (laccase) domain-containing protein